MKLTIDHIVLIVRDLKTTTDFYSSFIGLPSESIHESVCFKIGETKVFFGLPYGDYEFYDKDKCGLNHLAFRVNSLEELKAYEEKLNQAQIKNSGIQIDKYGQKEFIWFDDPDGYRLEFYLR
jgi:glyoxylase I family protein